MSKIFSKADEFTLEYNLFDLPTAQHKAGLAGLLVMIKSMQQRRMTPLPEVAIKPTTAIITFTRESMQILFDDLYGAKWIEKPSKQKWLNQKPKRIEDREIENNGKKKSEKRFIYDVVQPEGQFLQTFYPAGGELWIKLWRDMLWNTLRGIPATRKVYEERADNKKSSEAKKCWYNFTKALKNIKKGNLFAESLSSSVFIGAEAENAEKVPFKGAVEDNFLLNFWPIVSLIYVPRTLEIKRGEDQLHINRNESGYVLVIPEPFDLETFTEEIIEVLRELNSEKMGFRPRNSLIDLFEEGGLEYLYQFVQKETDAAASFTFSLHAIEIYHLQKKGNRVRQLAAGKILPNPRIINDYKAIRGSFKNPFYKAFYLQNLLNGALWFNDADAIFQQEPMPIFVYMGKTPKGIKFFGNDVKMKFKSIAQTIEIKKGANLMSQNDGDDQLALRIYRLVQTYIRRRTEEKSGTKYSEFKDQKNDKGYVIYPQKYREALVKVCSDAFLAMRGRRDQDFVEYFTGTICSVPQFMQETDFLSVAQTLMDKWRTVKTLSMLAISANSYVFDKNDHTEE